jgi:hypothetical protein
MQGISTKFHNVNEYINLCFKLGSIMTLTWVWDQFQDWQQNVFFKMKES